MSEPFIGEVRMVAFNFPPRGWAFCNGQIMSISANTALFSLLGCSYGGDCRTTFGLPDMRGRVPIHYGASTGPGLSPYSYAEKGGAEKVTLTQAQIPSHTHAARAENQGGNTFEPQNHVWSNDANEASATYSSNTPNVNMNSLAIGNTGGGQSHTNIQPFGTLNFCIALVGIYPSRN